MSASGWLLIVYLAGMSGQGGPAFSPILPSLQACEAAGQAAILLVGGGWSGWGGGGKYRCIEVKP